MLDTFFGEPGLKQFFRDHFLRLPTMMEGGAASLIQYGQWSQVEQILASGNADMVISREGHRWTESCSPNERKVKELVKEGYTLCIRHAESHQQELSLVASSFREVFCSPIDVHIYFTGGNTPGLNWHYDIEEVFMVQTSGSKHWKLRKNTVNPWPLLETTPSNMRFEREITPVYSCTLQPGDWLYLPAGYWHRTEALEESISLSIGVSMPTGVDLFDFLRSKLLTSLRWQQRLPVHKQGCDEYDIVERTNQLKEDLDHLLRSEVINEFLDWHKLRSRKD